MFTLHSAEEEIEHCLCANLLTTICGSIGSCEYRTAFMYDGDNGYVDVLNNGQLSCAYYVSKILRGFNLIQHLQVNVDVTIRALRHACWREVCDPLPGTVLVWEMAATTHGQHKHIGFSLGNNSAVSHTDAQCSPLQHGLIYNNRSIELILDHPRLVRTR